MVWNLACWCILITFKIIQILVTVDFPNFGTIFKWFMLCLQLACPRMQLFEADNEMTAITWESSQERFRHLMGFSWEGECWEGLFSIDPWANVEESCFLSPWDWPSHPSIPLCHPQSGSVPTLPAVQTCCVCKDPDDSLSCYGAMGITPPRVAAMLESVLPDPSRWLDYSATNIWIMWFQWTHPGPSNSWMLWMAL